MTIYADSVDRQLNDLPDHVRVWVAKMFPCHCVSDWTERGMHATNCQHVTAVDVLDSAYIDGILS